MPVPTLLTRARVAPAACRRAYSIVGRSVLSKLARHGIARVGHTSGFDDLLQPVQIGIYFFGREFSEQGQHGASESAQRDFHHFTNLRFTSLGSRGEMEVPGGPQERQRDRLIADQLVGVC